MSNDIYPVDHDGVHGFRLFAESGFRGRIGGDGQVFGSRGGAETFFVGDSPGSITFDPSFNRGYDEIVLAGQADEWQIAQFGSSVNLTNGDSLVRVPVGTDGLALIFDDGPRILRWDTEDEIVKLIGEDSVGQAVTTTPSAVSAPPILSYLGNDVSVPSSGKLFLEAESPAFVYASESDLTVFGSAGADYLTLWGGTVMLDPSFNRGGDTVSIQPPGDEITASRLGSSVVLKGLGLDVTIPVGTVGLTLNLGNSSYKLAYDLELNSIMIGDHIINDQTGPVLIPVLG